MICPTCNHNNLPGSDFCDNCCLDMRPLDLPAPHHRVERSLMDDPVSVLSPSPAVCLPPQATVADAIEVMLRYNIGAVPVVDDQGRLVGIFTERDLLGRVTGLDFTVRLEECMTRDPVAVRDSDSLALALHCMDSG